MPGLSGAINGGVRENGNDIADAETCAIAADAGARNIDFTLEDKTGLFQVAK